MIDFDAVDFSEFFSERPPEEVISFFWRSVYNENWICKNRASYNEITMYHIFTIKLSITLKTHRY